MQQDFVAHLAQPVGGTIFLKTLVNLPRFLAFSSLLSFASFCLSSSFTASREDQRERQRGSEKAMRGGIVQTSPDSHLQCYKALKTSTGAGSRDRLHYQGCVIHTTLSQRSLTYNKEGIKHDEACCREKINNNSFVEGKKSTRKQYEE